MRKEFHMNRDLTDKSPAYMTHAMDTRTNQLLIHDLEKVISLLMMKLY